MPSTNYNQVPKNFRYHCSAWESTSSLEDVTRLAQTVPSIPGDSSKDCVGSILPYNGILSPATVISVCIILVLKAFPLCTFSFLSCSKFEKRKEIHLYSFGGKYINEAQQSGLQLCLSRKMWLKFC